MEISRNTQRPGKKLKNWNFFYAKQRSDDAHKDSLPMEGNNLYFMPMVERNENLHDKSVSRKTELKCD